jgi:2-C-methyl-D-erythritol 4-phosphate cytidylyltransferase
MFRLEALVRALRRAGPGVTDEAQAMETLGMRPLLVRGDPANLKVTWPADLALAALFLESAKR